MKFRLVLLGLLVIMGLIAWSLRAPTVSDETVFMNGQILTMSEPMRAEAVHVKDGRIVATGSEADIAAGAPNASVIDLRGRTLMPGLIEPHTHPLATAMLGATADVSGFAHDSRASVMDALEAAASGFQPMAWTVAFGWDPVMLDDLDPPTLAELDAIAPERPLVVYTQMLHDAFLNSAALAAAGIDRDTPNPKGGEFVRDTSGELTGAVREVNAIKRVLDAIPETPSGVTELLLNLQYASYARVGYTTLGVLGPMGRAKDPLAMMARLGSDQRVPVRTVVYALPEQLDAGDWPADTGDELFRLRGVKFWMDGSPFAAGAALADPYEDNTFMRERIHVAPGHRGALNYDPEQFEQEFERFHRAGYQIAVHAQGERAFDLVLNAAEKVLAAYPRRDHRHRLEHCALMRASQMKRAYDLGFTVSFFIDHLRFYGHRLPEIVGRERTKRYMSINTARQIGHRVTIHTDNPATPIDPFRAMQTAIMRTPERGGGALAPSESLSIEHTLQAMTINAAWQLGIEAEVGSIEAGKRADFTIVDLNPLDVDPSNLSSIVVESTYRNGQPVDTRSWNWHNLALGRRALQGLLGLTSD